MAKTTRRCPRASYGAHSYAPGRGKTVALTFFRAHGYRFVRL